MSNANRKRRAQKGRRRQVDRTERVLPPPEAAQHYRPWPMQLLLAAGPEHGGIDSDEFEAALQIVETFKALVRTMDMTSSTLERFGVVTAPRSGMSERDARMIAVWLSWSLLLPRGVPARLVAWIEDEQAISSVVVLRHACRLWDRTRAQLAKENCPLPVDTEMKPVRLTNSASLPYGETAARPVNLPVQPFHRVDSHPAIECRSAPTGGQDHRPSGRLLPPQSGRLRRS
jgi:hypothetical protein